MSAFIAGNAAISLAVGLDPGDSQGIPWSALTGGTAGLGADD